ncbi:MAG: SUMF1/EgtB/PvdO family nonheme iron enzyme [Armatimonadetes bacterium]|nr:SUMF1/EgtB/PvdO family nonheme iron enzyme [Armatimonadota bacterium]
MSFVLACAATGSPPAFVTVPAGVYEVGKKGRLDTPPRKVRLKAYEIAAYETTNSQFAAFVSATGYVTDAERLHNALTFRTPLPEFRWIPDKDASWRYPNGLRLGGIGDKMDHPVTSISFADALAYCKWAKVRLPTLDEWEVACRAGTKGDWFFGDDFSLMGYYANVWHGRDHTEPDSSDGYEYTSPVGSFLPNPRGLYDMYGNVFEFCSGRMPRDKSKSLVHSRGGSWWCSAHACCFFNSADIGNVSIHASFSNQGFRVAKG